jgi:peptidylprolyl isomerase
VIELATHVAPQHVDNVKRLVRARYFDGLAIIRVQDNYVVQWDDADHRRPIPLGIRPSVELTADAHAASRFEVLPDRDLFAREVGFLDGFPAARDPATHTAWLAHCYGMVGAGRDDPPESNGTEMYAVIGHAPRQLDRNVALFGRVLMGMELLSSLPRGSGEIGVLRRPRAGGSHRLDAPRLGCPGGRAHGDRGAAHRERDVPRGTRAAARSA